MLDASFTVDGDPNPGVHVSTTSTTVDLALLSTSGASLIEWSIVAASDPDATLPTITPAGSPSGATASFTMGASSGSGIDAGVGYIVKCRVSNTNGESAEQTTIVGSIGYAGIVPLVPGEELERHATHGWGPDAMKAMNRSDPTVRVWIKYTGGTPAAHAFISRNTSLLVGQFTVADGGLGIVTVTVPADTLNGFFPPIATISAGGTGAFYATARPTANGAIVETYDGSGAAAESVDFLLDLW
jgi:hypothetical protein